MGEWKKYKLRDLTIDGKGTYGIAAPAIARDFDKYTYLRITDINDDGTLNKADLKSVDDINAAKYILRQHDIVFARTGASVGRSYYYEESDGILVYAGFLIKFSLDPNKVNTKILKYYTHSKSYYDWVSSVDNGATRGNINAQIYLDMPIELPSRAEQDRIVGILSALDDKIELNRRINANLEHQAQTLFNHWFVDLEFPNADGKPYKSSGGKLIDSPLGPIPEGWKVGNLGDLVKPRKGKNITRSQVKDGDIPVIAGGLTPSCFHCESNTLAPVITVSASGANAGFVQLHHTPVWASDSSYIDSTLTKYVYFIYVFLSIKQHVIYHKQQGCAQPHIYPSDLAELDMIVPNMVEIERFEKMCQPIFETIGLNIRENIRLSLLRDTLLPKLMNHIYQ